MIRSYKKNPITGYATCHSERLDKRAWYKRWRSHERIKLTFLHSDNLDSHCTIDKREVSNPWNMGKDGKHYFAYDKKIHFIKSTANGIGRNPQERSALKKRLLYKLMGK
jgi:hypothetical protein